MPSYLGYPIYYECRGVWHVHDVQNNNDSTCCYYNKDEVKYLIQYAIAWDCSISYAYRTLKSSQHGSWYNIDRFKSNLKKLKKKLKEVK